MMKGEDHLHDQYEDDEELQKLVMISNGGSKLENQNPTHTKTTTSTTTTTGMGKLELTVDEVIEEYVGTFGLSQLIHVFLVSLAWIFDSQQSLITIFSDAQPSWACKGGGGGNWCSSGNGESVCDLVGGKWEWVGGKGSSTIAEWGLVCDYKFLASIPASLFFLGSLFGSVFYGRLADAHIGRKKTVLLSCLLTSITAFLTSFSPNIWVYSLFRFLNGFARSGIGICCLVLSTEVVGRKWRGQVGQYGFFFFTLGFLSLPIIAYPTRTNWRNMYRIISFFPFAYSIVVLPFVSESPRWLVVKGRMDEAMDILNKLAKLNGKTLPNNFTILNPSLVETNQPGSTKSLWSARWARKRIITLMMAGFGVGFVYYGIQLNVENLDFNLYYTVALNAMMEIPAVFVGSLLLTYMNRRLLLSSSAYLAGFSCILCIFLSRNKKTSEEEGRHKSRGSWGQLTAEAVGFMAASTAFDVLYIYAVELFPTNVRNFAVSLLRQALMLGASLAPLLVALGRLSPSISFLIFGGLSLLSGCLMFCLPETRNSPLYETLEHQEEEERLSSSLDSGLELGKQ